MRNRQITQAVIIISVIAAFTFLTATYMVLNSNDSVDLKMKMNNTELDIKKEVSKK